MDMGPAGFWSYSHEDNEHDGQAILRLAARIEAEFSLVTGETLTLFVDRKKISWGDEWRRRIGTALAETTFFIPVITPQYFKRQECRNELLSFVGQAQSLGAIELVMPILYVEVPGLTEDSTDEACALVARMQYVDWRELRLCAEDSAEYRKGVNGLALRLAEISRHYELSDTQTIDDDPEAAEEGIIDLLGAVESKLPGWKEIVDNANTASDQVVAISNPYVDRLKKLASPGSGPGQMLMQGPSGAVLVILRGLANDTEPILRRVIQYTKDYVAASVDLDPLILQLLRLLEIYPEFSPHVFKLLTPIADVAKIIMEGRENPQFEASKTFLAKFKGMSKDYRRTVGLAEAAERYANDGDSLVLNWHQRIEEIKKRG